MRKISLTLRGGRARIGDLPALLDLVEESVTGRDSRGDQRSVE